MRRETLAAMTKAQLLDYARSTNLRGRSSMNKAQLVDALVRDEGEAVEDANRADESAGPKLPIPGVSQRVAVFSFRRMAALYRGLFHLLLEPMVA